MLGCLQGFVEAVKDWFISFVVVFVKIDYWIEVDVCGCDVDGLFCLCCEVIDYVCVYFAVVEAVILVEGVEGGFVVVYYVRFCVAEV